MPGRRSEGVARLSLWLPRRTCLALLAALCLLAVSSNKVSQLEQRSSAPGQLLPAPTSFLKLIPALVPAPAFVPASAAAAELVPAHALGFVSIAGQKAVRWAEQGDRPIRVRVENAPNVDGWSAADSSLVIDAFHAWEHEGAPVRFVLDTSANAEVVVHWIDHFEGPMSGWTTVTWDSAGQIHRSDVRLALRTREGQTLTTAQRRLLATHEFGHVLGLGHNTNASSIMSAVIYAHEIGQADILSVQRLYGLLVASR